MRGNGNKGRNRSFKRNAGQEEFADNGEAGPLQPGGGVLEMHPNGYGFLRDPKSNYLRELSDPFVPGSMIDKFRLREGVHLSGMVQPGRRNQGPRLRELNDVDGMALEDYREVKDFEDLTPVNPETKTANMPKEIITKLKQGKIEVGMTREEVLLSLGPPPLNMTPSGTKVTWIYFLNKTLKTTHIVFKNNKVSYVFNN